MNPIGGYFEMELNNGAEYHKNAIKLNTGRNAFEYILLARNYKKVYIPYYTCDVLLEPIIRNNISYEFYSIDHCLYPILDFSSIKKDEVILYTNYFGLNDLNVSAVIKEKANVIIDNAQAFYSKPIPNIDTFYSPRKFFGLPDGAYLYTNQVLDSHFEIDISIDRFRHLLGRIDLGPEATFSEYKTADSSLTNQPIKIMSKLTSKLLNNINYQFVKDRRRANYEILHKELKNKNQLKLKLNNDATPMVYPFLADQGTLLKKQLIKNKIFVATYWSNVVEWAAPNSLESSLANNLIPLPLDQRITSNQALSILSLINKNA